MSIKKKIGKLSLPLKQKLILLLGVISLLTSIFLSIFFWQKNQKLTTQVGELEAREIDLREKLILVGQELVKLKNEDQFLRNRNLQAEIKNIEKAYDQSVLVYENLLTLKEKTSKTQSQDEEFAESLNLLSQRNYSQATEVLTKLNQEIDEEKQKLIAKALSEIPATVPADNTLPTSGYRRQKVNTEVGTFMVSLVAADLNNTQVLVDTASDSDCANECPVLPLASYVARNNAFAGINGSYFCPATYPSCAEKKNSFDTLLMNKNKVYFNSANNIYSSVPAVIFYANTARFVAQSSEWGRDTSVDAVIANHPLLTFNGQLFFTGGSDPKQGSKGNRSFIGVTGNTVYIGVVQNATVAESARVMQALGVHSALNLDDGGSTALWSGGYKMGPGRDLANAVLLVRK